MCLATVKMVKISKPLKKQKCKVSFFILWFYFYVIYLSKASAIIRKLNAMIDPNNNNAQEMGSNLVLAEGKLLDGKNVFIYIFTSFWSIFFFFFFLYFVIEWTVDADIKALVDCLATNICSLLTNVRLNFDGSNFYVSVSVQKGSVRIFFCLFSCLRLFWNGFQVSSTWLSSDQLTFSFVWLHDMENRS